MSQITIDQALQIAVGHHQAGRLSQAEQTYRQILAVNPRQADALHLVGLIAGQRKNYDEATTLIRQAIEISPTNAVYHCNLGVFYQHQQKLEAAAAAYKRAIDLKPDYAEAHGNLGIVRDLQGETDLAIASYLQAIQLKPDSIEIQQNLGNALRAKKQFSRAIPCYQKALSLNPDLVEARFNLGLAFEHLGEFEKAIECYRKIIAQNPNDAHAHNALGGALNEQEKPDQALAEFHRAIQLKPDFIEAYCNLANSFNQLQQYDSAIESCTKALSLNPDYASAYSNLGLAFVGKGEQQRAIDSYERGIALNPKMVETYCNLAHAWCDQREFYKAIECCQTALKFDPDFAEAHSTLAYAFLGQGVYSEAVKSNLEAISRKPNFPEAFCNLGLSYYGMGLMDQAIESFRRAIAQKPNFVDGYMNMGNALKDVGRLDEAIAAFRKALEIDPTHVVSDDNLLYALTFDPASDAKAIFAEGQRWNTQHAQPLQHLIQPHTNDRNPDRPLRIGYVSPDFSLHPVGRFMLPLLAAHDRANYKIFCYADIRRADKVTGELQSYADVWHNTLGQSDEQLAQTIRNDQIDILVDLSLHMAGNRLLVFARKPAPVQATFAGYPGSTGLQAIDYRITDPYLDPIDAGDSFYSEKTIRLRDTFWCDPLISNLVSVNQLPAIHNGYVTFGSLNNLCKVNDSVLSLWARVLKAVPNSRLLILARQGNSRTWILDQMSRAQINPDRIEFAAYQPRALYLQIYNRIDIGLDTWPYNGQATSFDSSWMGVPVITLVGDTVVGRAGLSQLMNLKLPELVANTRDKYVQIAVELATDLPRLTQLRLTLRDRMKQSPLMDSPRFAKSMEEAYRTMWKNYVKDQTTTV